MKQTALYISLLSIIITGCRNKTETTSPVIAPITDAVFASGHVEAADQFTLAAFSDGFLQDTWIKENDNVQAGQILFTLDNTTSSIEQAAAAENLRLASQNASDNSPTLMSLRAELANAQQKLQNDSVQYWRMKRLYETNTVSAVEFEGALLAYENDKNTVQSIAENIASAKLTLQQDLIHSQSQYKTSVAGNNYFILKSPGNYKIYRIEKNDGELIRKGEAIALLGHPDSLGIVLMVDETGITKVRTGHKVLIELNTHPEQIYTGIITTIYPYFDEEKQSYKVEASFEKRPSNIIAGTLLQANIIVAQDDQAMLIPRAYLTADKKVIIRRNRNADTIAIKTGIISTDWVEVKEGLTLQDELIKAN
jgi:multidrug efflux pump subunit AcrA (membrane-fusion protein)